MVEGFRQSTENRKDKRRGGSGRSSGGFSWASEPSPIPPLPVGDGDLSCPETKEPDTSGGRLESRLRRKSSPTIRRWSVFKGVRPMNRLRRTVEVAVRSLARGLREENVRPITPLNRFLRFCGWCGTRCLEWAFRGETTAVGSAPICLARFGACVGRASTQDADEPQFSWADGDGRKETARTTPHDVTTKAGPHPSNEANVRQDKLGKEDAHG